MVCHKRIELASLTTGRFGGTTGRFQLVRLCQVDFASEPLSSRRELDFDSPFHSHTELCRLLASFKPAEAIPSACIGFRDGSVILTGQLTAALPG